MNALEKVAWTELAVSMVAVVTVLALYPWLGERAVGGFGLLGLLGLVPLLMIRRGDRVISDERDHEIARQAIWWGFGGAWFLMLMSLIAIALWHGYHEQDVSTKLIFALIWIQFALGYAVKGAAAVYLYRGGHGAA